MKSLLSFLAVLFLFATTAFAQPTRVIIIGWDGADYDTLRPMYDAGELPNLAALGSLSTMYISGITSTKPSWAKIFTGLSSEQTGVWTGEVFNAIPPGLTIFERLKTDLGTYNIFIAGKKHNLGIMNDEPFANAVWSFDAYSVDKQDKSVVYTTAKAFLRDYYLNNSQKPLLAFVHTGEPDYQGHQFGVDSPEYAAEVRGLDVFLGDLQSYITQLGMTNTYIMVMSDHGFNHLTVPYPLPKGKGLQNTHHADAPFGIIVSNFQAFTYGFNNMEMTKLILKLFGTPPLKALKSH